MTKGKDLILGDRLRALRVAKSWSQEKLSQAAGVSARTIERFERGGVQIRPDTLKKLADALGVSTDALLGEAGRPFRVFLSYDSRDKEAALRLHQRLIADGFDVWLDQENIKAGQKWKPEIETAIQESDV